MDDPRFAAALAVYENRADLAQHQQAVRRFAEIAVDRPRDREAQIWCARTAYYCAHRLDGDKPAMARIAELGVKSAERLERWHDQDIDSLLWAALARFKHHVAISRLPPLGEIGRMVRKLEGLVSQWPQSVRARMLLGALYRDLPRWPVSAGNKKRAVAILEQGAKLDPTDAELLLELAATYAAVGRKREARQTYEKCIRDGTGEPALTWETDDARSYARTMLAKLR